MRVIVPQVIFTTLNIIIIESKDQGIIKRIAGYPPIHKASSSLDVDGVGLISFARCGLRIGL